jgi:hypothetical protein
VLGRIKRVGINVFRMQNSLPTIAIKKVERCHHSKYYTDASAEPRCFRINLDKIKYSDQKYFEKQKGKFKLSERT